MEYIVSFFKMLWNLIYSLFDIVFNVVDSMIAIFKSLPAMLSVFLIALVAVSVIYKIISVGKSGE